MANNNSLNNTSYGFTLPSLNLNFTSTAQRITGDMSNATHANRLSFQTNVINGATSPFIIPNGSGTIGQIVVANASDPTNSAFGSLQADSTSVKLVSNVLGGGVQLPIEIRIGGTAAIDISTARAVSIANTVAGNVPLTITGTTSGGITINQTPVATALTLNGTNTAGTYAQQTLATVAGGIFNANRCLNLSNTAGSGCQIECSVTGQVAATGGDASLGFVNYGVQGVTIGLDTSVNQFSMTTGNLGDGNTFFSYDIATTQINKPRQCAFLAYLGSNVLNVTGNGAVFTLGTGTLLTEVYDQSNNFNTNGTFTAPKSGRYHFAAAIRVFGTGGLATGYQIRFNTTGGLIVGGQGVPSLGSGFFTATCSAYINMTTGDTCTLQIQLTGMAGDTADINGDISVTYFGGTLVC